MLKELPKFKGYTVDIRLKQFRIMKQGNLIFVEFKSEKGKLLLKEYMKKINTKV